MRPVASLPQAHATPHGASPTLAPAQAPGSDFAMLLEAMADQTQTPDELKAAADQAAAPGAVAVRAESSPASAKVAADVTAGDTPVQGGGGLTASVSISDAVNTQPKAGVEDSAQPGLDSKSGRAADPKQTQDNANALTPPQPLTLALNDVPAPDGTPAPEPAEEPSLVLSPGKNSDANPTRGKAETKSDSKKDAADLGTPTPAMVQQPAIPAVQQPALISLVAVPPIAAAPADISCGNVSPQETTPAEAIATSASAQAAGVVAAAAAVAGQAAGVAVAAAVNSDQPSPAAGQIAVVSKADGQTSKIALKGSGAASANSSQKSQLLAGQQDLAEAQGADAQPASVSSAVSNGVVPAPNGKATSDASGERKLSDLIAVHRSEADPVSGRSDPPPKDFLIPPQWSAAGGQPAASPHASATAASVAAANSAVANTLQQAAVPLAGVPVLIAGRALAGDHQFDIRLDPPELGRIEVRLKVDKQGQISSHLIADRPETLALLRRDGGGLERALQDAGLKTTGDGLQFSLRDQSGNGQSDRRPAPAHVIVDSNASTAREPLARNYVRLSGRIGGVDIRI